MGLMRCKQDSDCLAGSVCWVMPHPWWFCGAAGASGAEFGSGGQKQAEEAAAKAAADAKAKAEADAKAAEEAAAKA
ncbi:hypothetical protein GUG54_15430, partial [Xanthomonas citri pv. citri]|nr:hypothetical protein [Xanthomonas citri pv. citri]